MPQAANRSEVSVLRDTIRSMDTFKRAPLQLFHLPQHFVIPLFQRGYVWREQEQWEPLWGDVRRIAELRISDPHLNAQHFLGAVVLQAHPAGTSRMTTWNVIDGQQRLTTLQLLTDATSAIVAEAGRSELATQLEGLTHNPSGYVPAGESSLKVRHMNHDRAAFDEVMVADPPIDYASLDSAESLITRAHAYFTDAVSQWLGDPAANEFQVKAQSLAAVLQMDLQIVSIELDAKEDSQEIFETLNARGTPLTAADLVRNFVFQRLEAEGADTKRAYREDWPFEAKFWAKEVSVGRYYITRSSLFLNQWLMSRTGEEIGPQSTFTRFKAYVEHRPEIQMADLLPVLKQQAEQYRAWTEAAARRGGNLSAVEMAVYRMQAGRVELLKPLLIWLHEPGRDLPQTTIERIVSAAESWMMRRQLLRLTSADLGRIVADLIRTNNDAPAEELADRIINQLIRLNVSSTYWPGDDEIRAELTDLAMYRRFSRARLRAIMEAVENHYRAETSQPQIERINFPIEHLLPQAWQQNWPVETPQEADERQERVHRLGNLTLLTSSLNSKVSNGPWPIKRDALLEHNTIKMTGRLLHQTDTHSWSDADIDRRTGVMIDAMLEIWPVPAGHEGTVSDPASKPQESVEFHHLVDSGAVQPGDILTTTHRDFPDVQATVGEDRWIHLNGSSFRTPSGAGRHLRGKATNGWYFWRTADGRRLRDVRSDFIAQGRHAHV